MDSLTELPIEDVNTLCMGPLFIYQLMTCDAVNKTHLSDFHLIRAIDSGLVGNDENSAALIDHMKSNLDKYHAELKRCTKKFTTEMIITCITRISEMAKQYEFLNLDNYIFSMLSYAKYIAAGAPFSNISQHTDTEKLNHCLLKITNILVR